MSDHPPQDLRPGPRPSQRERAAAFHALHRSGVVVLPNCWDVATALLVQQAGAAALATTSAGVAWSLGAADGQRLPRDRVVDLVARTAAAVTVPVTADIESGYGATAAELGETVSAVLTAGAVGINLEDSAGPALRPVAEQCERLAAARAAADAAGVPLFLNARTDTYLLAAGDPAVRLAETLRRAAAYVGAGADGIFVPGVHDPATIERLARGVAAPLNVMAGPGAPAVDELAALGVRRVSLGPALAQAAYGLARRAATELLTAGTYGALAGGLAFAELDALLGG